MINLSYENYKNELKKRLEESKEFEAISEYQSDLTFNSPTYEIPMMQQDSVLAKKREIWHKNLSKDIYVEEALTVLSELKIEKQFLVKN